MSTMQEIYTAASQLPLFDRLRLAVRLLEDVVRMPPPLLDPATLEGYSGEWSEEDIREFAASSARYLDSQYPEAEDYPLLEEEKDVRPG